MLRRSGLVWTNLTGISSCGLLYWWGAASRFLTTAEGLNDAHRAAAVGAWFSECERDDLVRWWIAGLRGFRPEQGADLREIGLARGAGEQTVVADAMEAIRENVDQEAADELARSQLHDGLAVVGLDPIVLPAESDGLGIGTDQTAVRDRDPLSWFALQTTAGQGVGVSTEIGQHRLGAAEGRFGINHPVRFTQWSEPGGE